MKPEAIPISISSYVRRFVARRRWLALLRAAGVATAGTLGWMLLICALDRGLALPPVVRLMALLAVILAAGVVIHRPLVYFLQRRFDWIAAAVEMERVQPALGERLVTVISQWLAPPAQRGSPQLLNELSEEITRDLASTRAV